MTKALVPSKRNTNQLLYLVAGGGTPATLPYPVPVFCPRPPPSPSGTITAAYGQPQNHSIPVYEMKFPDLCVY